MIFLFTDFGYNGPYIGQMKSVIYDQLPDHRVIDLMQDAPRFNPKASAYLLAALADYLPENALTTAVVDPGVGSDRRPIAVNADGRWFIGPDNGLLEIVGRRAERQNMYEIDWQPSQLSASFHGRDLFAPVTVQIARSQLDNLRPLVRSHSPASWNHWPNDLAEVIYIDDFGNAMTGIRFDQLPKNCKITLEDTTISVGRTFSDVAKGAPLAYRNSLGLLEIAVNQDNAAKSLNLSIGGRIDIAE